MRTRHLLPIVVLTSLLQAGGDGPSDKIDHSHALVRGWLQAGATYGDTLVSGLDSVLIDTDHPNFRYPGRAMLMSFLVPGLGQLYTRKPLRAALFVAVDVAAYFIWQDYNSQGDERVGLYRSYVDSDSTWDFRRWWNNADNFNGGGWEKVHVGQDGTHELDFIVEDMDGDGQIEHTGSTGDTDRRLETQLAHADTSQYVKVRKTGEYYENIGKYNQFFSGWSDADPFNPDIVETASGYVAWSPSRKEYVGIRGDANQLKSIAGYAVSAALFNHVISAVDALFATSAWNREHALVLSGRLLRSPGTGYGVTGVELSLIW